MPKRLLATLITCALYFAFAMPAQVSANTTLEEQIRFAEKVKTGIIKLGVGPDARVEVKLRDKTKLSGFISEVNDSSFVVTNAKTGASTVVAYPDVQKVKGNNLSTGQKFAVAAIIVGALAIIYFAVFAGKHL
jgi:hypothetical protein